MSYECIYKVAYTPPLIRVGCDPAHAEHNKMMHGTYLGSMYENEGLSLPPL